MEKDVKLTVEQMQKLNNENRRKVCMFARVLLEIQEEKEKKTAEAVK